MPLSDADRKLIAQFTYEGFDPSELCLTMDEMRPIFDALRAKERAKAEGELQRMTDRWARAGHAASERSNQLQHALNKNVELQSNLAKAEARIAELTQEGEEPSEAGAFVGDIFFGDREHTTRGTHRWSGSAWERLPSEEEVLTELLAKARAERDTWRKTAERMVEEPDALAAALARATQAEELVREAIGDFEAIDALEVMEINPSNYDHELVCELSNNAVQAALIARAALAKLKAEGSSSDSVESAARLASQGMRSHTAEKGRLMGSAYDSDEDFTRLMDDMQVLYQMRAGDAVSQADVDALNRLDEHWREDGERVADAFHNGWQQGLRHAGGADLQQLQEKLSARGCELAVAKALGKFDHQRGFREGAQACREMLARFVEQGGDAVTAASLRANWSPAWGADPGPPPPADHTAADRSPSGRTSAPSSTGGEA